MTGATRRACRSPIGWPIWGPSSRRSIPPSTPRPTSPICDDLQLRADPYEAVAGAQVLVVLTEWDEFRWLDFARVLTAMAEPRIVDARNLLDPAAVRRMGFQYSGIGRQ